MEISLISNIHNLVCMESTYSIVISVINLLM